MACACHRRARRPAPARLKPRLQTGAKIAWPSVLGGAGFIMFGMVAATGIKILATVDYAKQRNSVLVVAISIGFGLIPIVSPTFFHVFPDQLKPIFGDGIILTSIAAVALNAFFNRTSREQAEAETFLAAQAAEHI
ncbi:MAG: solute carrier family 23 protein [Xanthobacteraceae bacterium]